MKTINQNLYFLNLSISSKNQFFILFLFLISPAHNLFAQNYNGFNLNADNNHNADTTKRVQYRRTIEPNENQQSYEQKYFGKDLNEVKRSLFPFESTGAWTELNPKVPRVDYLGINFVNKDTGWACGDLGALIKTINGGDSWDVKETNTTTMLLKVSSYDGKVVIVTGYDGLILRSNDGGETFKQVFSGVGSGTDLWGVKMLNDSIGFVCGLNQTLLKTTDAGLTWLTVSTGFNQHYWALEFLTEQYGMIACGNGKVLKTTDGGNSWAEYQAGDASSLFSLDIIDSLHIVLAGANGKNVYSSDGGETWIQNSRLQHDELNSIKFIDTDTGYTIGTYGGESWGIRKTTNRGVTWFGPPIQNLSEWELELLLGGTGYSVGSDLWINKTTGAYDNWQGLFLNAQFVDVYFTDELTGYAADGRYTGGPLYKTTDGGNNWFGLPNFPSQVFTSTLRCVTFTDSVTGFAGSAPCRIVKTTDAGNSWYIVNRTGLTDTIGLINKIYFINKTTGWAVTTRGGILKTTDAGENWFAQLNAGVSVIFQGIYFVDSLYGWTSGSRPHKTTDGGNYWVQQTNTTIWNSNDVYFPNQDTGWIAKRSSINTSLFKTTNGGITWVGIPEVLGASNFYNFPDKNHWLVTGSILINFIVYKKYITYDSGNNWIDISNDAPVGFGGFLAVTDRLGYAVGSLGLILRYNDTIYVPVELISFEGIVENNKIILIWQTASEINNMGFQIEKSIDKINWFNIGFVNGNGTTTNLNHYSFFDSEIISGVQFYRLKQIDYDGSFEYSKIIALGSDINIPTFHLFQNFPNPFNSITVIKYSIPNTGYESVRPLPVTLKVYDILGNEIIVLVSEEKPAGNYEAMFAPVDLVSGVYFYKLTSGGNIQTRKLIFMK